jgi:hypothetical protein
MGDRDAILKTIRRFSETTEQKETIQMEHARLQQAIAKQFAERAAQGGTNKLSKETRDALPLLSLRPYGLATERPANLITLPVNKADQRDFCWLIEMQGLGEKRTTLSIEAKGDIVLGITRPGQPAPDLDLCAFGGEDKGVSRRHAVIRPTPNRRYLIDLQSTNGTRVNSLPINVGMAIELHGNDTINLGAFIFTLKVFATPEMMKHESLRAESDSTRPMS